MIDLQDITQVINDELGDGDLFPVDVKIHGDEVEIFIDSDGRVTVDDCIALSRAIEARFDRDVHDFSLTVSSAGIGQPLKVLRQYFALVGHQVEVVVGSGAKLIATLEAVEAGADGDNRGGVEGGSITLSYPEKLKVEGQKRPQTVMVTKTFALSEIKTTKEYIDFR